MNPAVTVLTTVYNGLPYLKDAIESTLDQTYTNFEYLIIDDCSTDKDVVKLIKSYTDPRIRFVQNEKNLGVSDTFNKALTLITTPYLIRLDQDDISLPNRVSEQFDYFENHSDVSVLCSWEHIINAEGKICGKWKRNLNNYGDFLGPILLGICPIWHPSIAFRTNDLIKAGGFKKEYTRSEDFEVTSRMALLRFNAAIIPQYHLLQRQHKSSQSFEFNEVQAAVTKKIHLESIKYFIHNNNTEDLADFLTLAQPPAGKTFNKKYLNRIHVDLNGLYRSITEKQKLTNEELVSLKRIIYKRIGFGIKIIPLLNRLPSFIFHPLYYTFSPLQIRGVRKFLSKIYFTFVSLRFKFK